jgi:hypothetical protein
MARCVTRLLCRINNPVRKSRTSERHESNGILEGVSCCGGRKWLSALCAASLIGVRRALDCGPVSAGYPFDVGFDHEIGGGDERKNVSFAPDALRALATLTISRDKHNRCVRDFGRRRTVLY